MAAATVHAQVRLLGPHGKARCGSVRRGAAWLREAGKARRGRARRGAAWQFLAG